MIFLLLTCIVLCYTLFINFQTNNLIKTREPRKLIVSGVLSSSLSTSCLISITFEMVDLSIQGPLIGNNQNHNSCSVVQKISKPFISMDMVSLFRSTFTLPHLSHSSYIVAVKMINICFPPLKIENPPYIHKSKSSGFKIQENSIHVYMLFLAFCYMPAKNLCDCVISTNKTFIKIDIYCVPLNINEEHIPRY